jgi:hypothetical protein
MLSTMTSPSFLLALVLGLLSAAMGQTPQTNYGLIGYGIPMYQPTCAFACQAVLVGGPLNCSIPMNDPDMPMGSMVMDMTFYTDPSCYATDDAFLQSLAFCIEQYCLPGLSAAEIESFWETYAVGTYYPQPTPKESWQQALDAMGAPPADTVTYGDPLNVTMGVAADDYMVQWGTLSTFAWVEDHHSTAW